MSKSKERIRESQLSYKQGLGQNFLYDEELLRELVQLSGVDENTDVLEIGPGTGSMTKSLCQKAHHVTSIELDERLIPLLRVSMENFSNFTLIAGDALKMNIPEITSSFEKPIFVVANIPYYITTPIINMFLAALGQGVKIRQMAFMVQHEVCEKILALPGSESWGMLAVKCQYFCAPFCARHVPAECFTPVPKVDSDFVVMPVLDEPSVNVMNQGDFFRIASSAFALRRKTMVNNLCATFHMERADAAALMAKCDLDEKIRGEKLTLEELGRLSDAFTAMKKGAVTNGNR